MFIKYARMNLQEAEAAIQDDQIEKARSKCRDCAISLIKAVREAFPGKGLSIDPVDYKGFEVMLFDLTDSREAARNISGTIGEVISRAGSQEEYRRIEAEKLLDLVGNAFRMIHDLFTPGSTF